MAEDWRQDAERVEQAAAIDSARPNAARVADYLNGGTSNFEADRQAARMMTAAAAVIGLIPHAARAFRQRVLRFLVAEAGIRQFLDVGADLAEAGATHEVAQAIDPGCRVVYVDSDPVVLAHARALRSGPDGIVACLDADVRDTRAVLAGAMTTLDFGQPLAVLLLSISTLAYVADTAAAGAVVSELMAAAPAGSHVALYHHASDLDRVLPAAIARWNMQSSQLVTLRSRAEVAGLVAGLRHVPPGLVPITEWRPEPGDPCFEYVIPVYGVVARKP